MGLRRRWRAMVDKHTQGTVLGVLVLLICIASGCAFWLSFQRVAGIYLHEMERIVREMQEDFLQVSVDNLVLEIQGFKEAELQRLANLAAGRRQLFELELALDPARLPSSFRELMEGTPELTGVLWNRATGELLYGAGELRGGDPAVFFAFYEELVHGDLEALWGVSRSFLEARLREAVREQLARQQLGRGMWLSISKGPRGAEPDQGLSYSRWYEEFGWRITMGVHPAELQGYLSPGEAAGGKLLVLLSLRLVLILVLVVVAALGLVVLVEYLFFRRHTDQLELAVSEDLLTGAKSRRAGVEALSSAFAAFQGGEESPDLFMFDLDRLKQINDSYGHSAGDQVLQMVAAAVRRALGGAGEIIRWGGDEFVVLAWGQGPQLGESMVQAVSALSFSFDGELVQISISLGAARFEPGDQSFQEALERADQALYVVKRAKREALER